MNDLPSDRGESEAAGLIPCAAATVAALLGAPAFAQADLAGATAKLSLQVATEMLGERSRRIEAPDAAAFASVSLHRTFDRISAYQIDER